MGMYKYCDDELFVSLRARLDVLEETLAPLIAGRGFWVHLRRDDYWGPLLYVNLNYHGWDINGNIGFRFVDEPNVVPMFTFWVLKTLDAAGPRYSLHANIFDRMPIDALESGIVEHWNAAFALWEGWGVDNLLTGKSGRVGSP